MCACTCMYVSFYNKNTYFCHILLLGVQLYSTLPGRNERPAWHHSGRSLRKEGKGSSSLRKGLSQTWSNIFQHTNGSFLFLKDFIFFFSNDQLGLGCGLWCIFWSGISYTFSFYVLLKCLHIFCTSIGYVLVVRLG